MLLFVVLAATLAASPALASRAPSPPSPPRPCVAPHDGYPFCNTSLSLAARVDDLVARLALDEKPFLLVARGTFAEKSAFFHLFSTVVLMMCC
jgi:hypothetical protein